MNGGFVPDGGGYSVLNEKMSPENRVCPREPRDFDKEDEEVADDLIGANGHARLIPDDSEEKKEEQKEE